MFQKISAAYSRRPFARILHLGQVNSSFTSETELSATMLGIFSIAVEPDLQEMSANIRIEESRCLLNRSKVTDCDLKGPFFHGASESLEMVIL